MLDEETLPPRRKFNADKYTFTPASLSDYKKMLYVHLLSMCR